MIDPGRSGDSPFSPPGAVLMRADDGAVDHLDRRVARAAGCKRVEQFLENPRVPPPGEPAPDGVPLAEPLRQIAPGRSRAGDPQDALEDAAVVDGWATGATAFRRQEGRDQRPGGVVDLVSGQGWLPISSLESR